MNPSFAVFTNPVAHGASVSYYRKLREMKRYIDLEIEVSCCSTKQVSIYSQTAGGTIIWAHRWVMEARYPMLRALFRDNLRSQQLTWRRFSTASVACIQY